MSQPRGGPMLTGHASHQIGLDADIWLTPMPERTLSREEREEMSAINVVREDGLDVNEHWTPQHIEVIKAAAQDPAVERIFVNAAIKKAVCRKAGGDRSWLAKVRPWFGHDYHFHVRIHCPEGDETCTRQDPVLGGEGCDDASLAYWFSDAVLHPKPDTGGKRKPLTMAQLPEECRRVLVAK
jgi:penicillin-insensitive murein DD-endopeptidase